MKHYEDINTATYVTETCRLVNLDCTKDYGMSETDQGSTTYVDMDQFQHEKGHWQRVLDAWTFDRLTVIDRINNFARDHGIKNWSELEIYNPKTDSAKKAMSKMFRKPRKIDPEVKEALARIDQRKKELKLRG